ncbi:hypothetical protein ABEB36_002180 [Hypothenemus hampei]|uniref:Uncharacterized protein n=1 Tax=Hypothenemus hampei TaxID=57062 RepID=A0ABD1F7Z2_HYPHA
MLLFVVVRNVILIVILTKRTKKKIMTLPVALLIASYKNESTFQEIQEVLDSSENLSLLLEPFSCKCLDHRRRSIFVPPSLSCSSETSSPVLTIASDLDIGNYVGKSYSYFSDEPDNVQDLDQDNEYIFNARIGRRLSDLVDLVENLAARYNPKYLSNENEVKINYENRDILDLGTNIREPFAIKFARLTPEQTYPIINFNEHRDDFRVIKKRKSKSKNKTKVENLKD